MTKAIQTPWGIADDIIQYRKGFYFYSTSSHGGFYLSPRYNSKIPSEFRNEGGWYEEDCEALKVHYFLSEITNPISKSCILEELEDYLGLKIGV